MTSRRKKLLLSFASFVSLVAAFLIIEHCRGTWALDRWQVRMAAKGEELNIDKLTPPPVMADENGMPQLLWVAGQLGPFPNELQPPASRIPTPGKWAVITRVNEWHYRSSRRTNVTWVDVAENVAACEQQLNAALEALQSSAFNANHYYRGGFMMPVTHLARLRPLAQFFSVAVLHDLHQGQLDAAFRNLKGLLAVPEVLKDEPMIVSQLVRMATMQIAFAATWQSLQCDGWSESQLASLQDCWSAYDFLGPMDKALAMERAMACFQYERVRAAHVPLTEFFDQGTVAPPPTPSLLSWDWVGQMFDPRERVLAPIWKFAWSKHDELHYCRTVQAVLEIHRTGIASKAGTRVLPELERRDSTPTGYYDRLRFLLGRMLSGSFANSMRRAWTAQTTSEITRAAIAIKRYELREGKLPRSLEVLVPDFMCELPIDYMDGKPLRYCLDENDSFRLYSVGVDGIDDHGDARFPSNAARYQSSRDIIWPQPASESEVAPWLISGRSRVVPASGK